MCFIYMYMYALASVLCAGGVPSADIHLYSLLNKILYETLHIASTQQPNRSCTVLYEVVYQRIVRGF